MTAAVESFGGLEHAMELVAEVAGVRFVNDSKATNVDPLFAPSKVSMAGSCRLSAAASRAGTCDVAGPLAARAKAVVAIGEARSLVREALADAVRFTRRVLRGRRGDRLRPREPAGVVLLAPACASFDMFRDYAERGRRFKEEVARLARWPDVEVMSAGPAWGPPWGCER
jgi:UDP-N-acetylmuramoylalanine--D-glutamate ligase